MTSAPDITSVSAATTAVIVVDMQNDFCHPDGYYASTGRNIGPLSAAIAGVERVVESAREFDVMIVFTQLTHDAQHGAIEDRHTIKPRKWSATGRRLIPGSWGAGIVDECTPRPGDIIVEKYGYSAFEGTQLEQVLRERGITTVLLCGVVTYACVLSTAFSAFDKGFDVCLVSDAVGSWRDDLGVGSGDIVDLLLGRSITQSQLKFTSN